MKTHTSLELSKWLTERGFKQKSSAFWLDGKLIGQHIFVGKTVHADSDLYPAYDLLWDICIKYGEDIFGKDKYVLCTKHQLHEDTSKCESCKWDNEIEKHHNRITYFLSVNMNLAAEQYIRDNSVL